MKKYVVYFNQYEDRYYIEYTEVWEGKFGLEFHRGLVPLRKAYDNLEDARKSLKNAIVYKPIVEIL